MTPHRLCDGVRNSAQAPREGAGERTAAANTDVTAPANPLDPRPVEAQRQAEHHGLVHAAAVLGASVVQTEVVGLAGRGTARRADDSRDVEEA